MTKQQHNSYLRSLDTLLIGMSASKRVSTDEDQTPTRITYTLDTQFGPLELSPDLYCFTRRYSLTVFGFFTAPDFHQMGAWMSSRKWNMHPSDDCLPATALEQFQWRLSTVAPVAVA